MRRGPIAWLLVGLLGGFFLGAYVAPWSQPTEVVANIPPRDSVDAGFDRQNSQERSDTILPSTPVQEETILDDHFPDEPPFESGRGIPASNPNGLIIPVEGIGPDQLVDTYTSARSGGRTHDAIDIMAPEGTPVRAAIDGHILRLFLSEKGGITIYQMGPDGRTVYYYAHLQRYADGIAEGKSVRQGETIGYVGNTGNAGPENYHLHFAIWIPENPKEYWDGVSINPYNLLKGKGVTGELNRKR